MRITHYVLLCAFSTTFSSIFSHHHKATINDIDEVSSNNQQRIVLHKQKWLMGIKGEITERKRDHARVGGYDLGVDCRLKDGDNVLVYMGFVTISTSFRFLLLIVLTVLIISSLPFHAISNNGMISIANVVIQSGKENFCDLTTRQTEWPTGASIITNSKSKPTEIMQHRR